MNNLFIPGPTSVADEILAEMTKPMIGHRGETYAKLHGEVINHFKTLFRCKNYHVFLITSSASGIMEGTIRNVVQNKLLHAICGAFSEKWGEISRANGKKIIKIEVPWGKAVKPDTLKETLIKHQPEAIAFTYCETSTGVLNPLPDLCQAVRKFSPKTLILVDAVSAFGGVPLEMKNWDIDVMLFGVQKCFALPPGLAIAVVSQRAFEKSLGVKNKGYYFNFAEFAKSNLENNTPATPMISLIYALRKQLQRIANEGLEARFKRHQDMLTLVAKWADQNNFTFFSEKGFQSPTVSALNIENHLTVEEMIKSMKEKDFIIAGGYGPLKKKTFRIGHMGEHTPDDTKNMLVALSDLISLKKTEKKHQYISSPSFYESYTLTPNL